LKGKDGLEKIASMMDGLRQGTSPFADTKEIIDYSRPVAAELGFGFLPTSKNEAIDQSIIPCHHQ
ncbi:MAG: hypothetical protein IKG72_12045, partial [Bacillus sp. (in: Bacteria)]|nr:hypothetical protein [Bacillus sp. (in: firmicutes)]